MISRLSLGGSFDENAVSPDLEKQAVIMSNLSVLCVVRGIRKAAAGHDFRPRVCRDGEG
jgi:hypothetical protein